MLCGRRATDYSMASCTLLFDQRKLDWSEELLELSGIDRRLMCDAYPSGTLLGEVTAEASRATRLAAGTPVVLGGHDHLCGALPVGAFRPGTVLNVIGTWDTVLTATAQPVLSPELRKAGMTVQAHVARGMHATWGSNVGGQMLEWYRGQFGDQGGQDSAGEVDWDRLMAPAAQSPPGARRVMFLPHMSAASCPVVDQRSLGAFVGLSNLTTKQDMLRAMIEGLSYQLLDVVTALESGLDAKLEKLVAVGGGTRNEVWMQNKADVTGRPIDVPGAEEATPLGAAILAGIGVGRYRDEEDAFDRVSRPGRTYEPNAELSRRYADGFQVYKQLYPALAPISHRLFDGLTGVS
jgi:xylulokinase